MTTKATLTVKVVRGIIALGKPGVAEAINFPISREEMHKKNIWYKDVDDAIRALEWASSVHQKIQTERKAKEYLKNESDLKGSLSSGK